jgi:hypothetical protein
MGNIMKYTAFGGGKRMQVVQHVSEYLVSIFAE